MEMLFKKMEEAVNMAKASDMCVNVVEMYAFYDEKGNMVKSGDDYFNIRIMAYSDLTGGSAKN